MHIGKRIAKLRMEKNYSQAGLSKGVTSGSHLSNIEAGRYDPSEDILVPFAKELDVPEDYLLKHDQHDGELEKLLVLYKESIVLNMDSAKDIRSKIHKGYPIIYSIEQEIYFYLCEASFLFKKQKIDEALEIYNEQVEPYIKGLAIEEILSDSLKELYFYFHGGRCFYQLRYAESLHYYRKQLPYIHNHRCEAAILYNLPFCFLKLVKFRKESITVRRSWTDI